MSWVDGTYKIKYTNSYGGWPATRGGLPAGRHRRPLASGEEPKMTVSGAPLFLPHDLSARRSEAIFSSAPASRQCGSLVHGWIRSAGDGGQQPCPSDECGWGKKSRSSRAPSRFVRTRDNARGLWPGMAHLKAAGQGDYYLVKKLHFGCGGHGPLSLLRSSAVATSTR